jgi:hypothetical protein
MTRLLAPTLDSAVALAPDSSSCIAAHPPLLSTADMEGSAAVADLDLDLDNKSSVQLRKMCSDLGIPANTWDPDKLKISLRAHFGC